MPREDDFPAATKRIIAERSGFVCAYPSCMAPTSGPAIEGSRAINIGVAAHISAASPLGPRFDSTMSSEQRQSPENGIWMCATHATLIDRDIDRYSLDLLREWKSQAENRAFRVLGQARTCSQGKIATISPATRLGANYNVFVHGQSIPYAPIFDPDVNGARVTWFVSGFVIQFLIQKRQNLVNAVLEHLVVTVHETKPVPKYQYFFAVYPAEANLFYVEIEASKGAISREFIPTRYYTKAIDGVSEMQHYPSPLVLNDDFPTPVALRFNAKSAGLYLLSTEVVISSGEERERLPVMPPQWAIFEIPNPD